MTEKIGLFGVRRKDLSEYMKIIKRRAKVLKLADQEQSGRRR